MSHRTYRWVRQIHLWIGAWGALAAILYGFTGLVLNHRIGENAWPQGDTTEIGRETFEVPAQARITPEALSLWLRATHQLDATSIRKGPPGGNRGVHDAARDGARGGRDGSGNGHDAGEMPSARGEARDARGEAAPAPQWNLSGGDAAASWSLEYRPGQDSVTVKHNKHSPLAAFGRLHKGVGGGAVWLLLADSFAIGMLLLGLSGIWMWARGRTPRQMVLSVLALSTLVLIVVLGPALL